jgi:hypothetical protein
MSKDEPIIGLGFGKLSASEGIQNFKIQPNAKPDSINFNLSLYISDCNYTEPCKRSLPNL